MTLPTIHIAYDSSECVINLSDVHVPTPTPNAGVWTDYDGAFLGDGKKVVWATISANNGQTVFNPPQSGFSSYAVGVGSSPMAQSGDICGIANWGGSLEYHRIPAKTVQGVQWGWLDGFASASVPGSFYPIETVRADWTDVDRGAKMDITPTGAAPQGHPYCVFQIPASGHFRRQVWGWIWNSMSAGRSRPFYSQSDFWFGQTVTNVAWKGADQTRACVKESDAWWDSGTWVHATSSQHPFDDSNNPVVVTDLVYTGFDQLGRGAGAGWEYAYGGYVVGVESISNNS